MVGSALAEMLPDSTCVFVAGRAQQVGSASWKFSAILFFSKSMLENELGTVDEWLKLVDAENRGNNGH